MIRVYSNTIMICHFRHVPRVGETSVWKIRFIAVRPNKKDWTKGLNKKKLCLYKNRFLLERFFVWTNCYPITIKLLSFETWFVCWFFLFHSRILHWYGDVTITGQGLHILTYAQHLWPLWGFFSVQHLLWQGASVYNSHLRRAVTLTPTA